MLRIRRSTKPPAPARANATSTLEQVSLALNSVTGEFASELKCEDVTEGGGPGACAASYPYGHTVKVDALSPETDWELEPRSAAPGSAASQLHDRHRHAANSRSKSGASAVNATSTLEQVSLALKHHRRIRQRTSAKT